MITITSKAEQKRLDAIKKRNDAFNALSKWEQRITVARDVLAQLASGLLTVAKGHYVKAEALNAVTYEGAEASDVLANQSCTVCGLDSLFVCGVLRGDNFQIDSHDTQNSESLTRRATYRYLQKFFDVEQLYKIEAAFELKDYSERDGADFDATPSIMFGRVASPHSAKERLRLIMENIVANEGSFDPTELPVAEAVIVMKTPNYTK